MSRFATVGEEKKKKILEEKDAPNTKKAGQIAYNVFINYCREKNITIDISTVTKEELNELLRSFYVEVRKGDGSFYKKTSFTSLRFGLQREFKRIRPDINIIDDPEFSSSFEMYKAQCVQLKAMGLAKVEHKMPISKTDMELLYSSGVFSIANPVSLLKKVFFEVVLYLCRRGIENLRKINIDDFEVKKFSDGTRYIVYTKDELKKNLRVNDEYLEGGYIVENGDENCPLKSFLLYVNKLNPSLKCFFQRPKRSIPSDGPWFDNMVLGEKSLEGMMKKISKEANLSHIYTNHCIRATCITLLDRAGVEARHIMAISGHKSESSIRSYASTSGSTKRKLAQTISAHSYAKENRTFDFGLKFLEDEDEAPERFAAPPVPTASSGINVRDEKPHGSNTAAPMSILFNSCSGRPAFNNCYFNF